MALTVELLTTITISLIVVVLAVYLVILKRNGWIGKSTNYRCPNPTCKKIFQNPMKVADLADTSRTHLACPECGFELDSNMFKKKSSFTIIENETAPIQNNYLIINKMDNQTGTSEKSPFINSPKSTFETKPQIVSNTRGSQEIKYPSQFADNPKNVPAVASSLKSNTERKPLLGTNAKTTFMPVSIRNNSTTSKTAIEPKDYDNNSKKENKYFNKSSKAIQIKPAGCKFYLGHLYTLPKGTPIPYNCYACTRLIDCYKPLEDRKE